MKKICNFCGNKNFREKHVQYVYRHDGQFLVVNNVPCEECKYCGEKYFKAGVLKKIEKDFMDIYRAKKKAKKVVKLPIEEFVEIYLASSFPSQSEAVSRNRTQGAKLQSASP